MGAGIAVEFKKRGVQNYLMKMHDVNKWDREGYALFAPVEHFKGSFNLVTKSKYYMKPTYKTIEDALIDLRRQLNDDSCIAMPYIGCGLDKLEWFKVKNIIRSVFGSTNVEVSVYHI